MMVLSIPLQQQTPSGAVHYHRRYRLSSLNGKQSIINNNNLLFTTVIIYYLCKRMSSLPPRWWWLMAAAESLAGRWRKLWEVIKGRWNLSDDTSEEGSRWSKFVSNEQSRLLLDYQTDQFKDIEEAEGDDGESDNYEQQSMNGSRSPKINLINGHHEDMI